MPHSHLHFSTERENTGHHQSCQTDFTANCISSKRGGLTRRQATPRPDYPRELTATILELPHGINKNDQSQHGKASTTTRNHGGGPFEQACWCTTDEQQQHLWTEPPVDSCYLICDTLELPDCKEWRITLSLFPSLVRQNCLTKNLHFASAAFPSFNIILLPSLSCFDDLVHLRPMSYAKRVVLAVHFREFEINTACWARLIAVSPIVDACSMKDMTTR